MSPPPEISLENRPPKFSDLNAYFQGLQTRLSVSVAVLALLLGTIASLRPLLPSPPAGAPHLLGLLAIGCVVVGFVLAASTLRPSYRFTLLIENRLASRDLVTPDDVSAALQTAFLSEIRQRHRILNQVFGLFVVSVLFCLGHVHALIVSFGKSNVTEDMCQNFGIIDFSQLTIPACAFAYWSIINFLIISVMGLVTAFVLWLLRVSTRRNMRQSIGVG